MGRNYCWITERDTGRDIHEGLRNGIDVLVYVWWLQVSGDGSMAAVKPLFYLFRDLSRRRGDASEMVSSPTSSTSSDFRSTNTSTDGIRSTRNDNGKGKMPSWVPIALVRIFRIARWQRKAHREIGRGHHGGAGFSFGSAYS